MATRQNRSDGVVSRQQGAKQLQKQFEAFRGGGGTRVPNPLRRQVLEAVDAGLSTGMVRRLCGVTRGQLDSWRKQPELRRQRRNDGQADIFTVVDTGSKEPEHGHPDTIDLKMGIGTWRLCLRLYPDGSQES